MSTKSINILIKSKMMFSIPIYFRSQEDSFKSYKFAEEKYINEKKLNWEQNGGPFPDAIKISYEVRFNMKWPNWKYNEIISFIEVRYLKGELFAFFYVADADRFNAKMPNKKFVWKDNSPFSSFQIKDKTNTEVLNWILSLRSLIVVRINKYRNYYFDFSSIENLSSAIDFSKLAT